MTAALTFYATRILQKVSLVETSFVVGGEEKLPRYLLHSVAMLATSRKRIPEPLARLAQRAQEHSTA